MCAVPSRALVCFSYEVPFVLEFLDLLAGYAVPCTLALQRYIHSTGHHPAWNDIEIIPVLQEVHEDIQVRRRDHLLSMLVQQPEASAFPISLDLERTGMLAVLVGHQDIRTPGTP